MGFLALTLLLILSPEQARRQPMGSTVTIDGYVTVPAGAFSSFMGDRGFVLGNEVAGIYVATDLIHDAAPGSALKVRGVLADNGHGLLILKALDIRSRRGHRLIRPREVTLDQIDETHEGRILQVDCEVVRPPEPDLPAGHKLFVRHPSHRPNGPEVQVFLPASVPPDPALLTPGRRLRISGFSAQYDHTYELIVRSAQDIQPAR